MPSAPIAGVKGQFRRSDVAANATTDLAIVVTPQRQHRNIISRWIIPDELAHDRLRPTPPGPPPPPHTSAPGQCQAKCLDAPPNHRYKSRSPHPAAPPTRHPAPPFTGHPQRAINLRIDQNRRLTGKCQHRGKMARRGQLHPFQGGLEYRQLHRGQQLVRIEVLHLLVEFLQNLGRIAGEQRHPRT
jgi:hypothetical protein